ncbi:hypothetical protein SBADM41S_06159 [Streptomyces badius]
MVRAGLTVERVVRAGAELADEIGFEQVTPSELARKLDIRTASLYSHVKNAHDLKTRIALLVLEELADQASAAIAGRAGRDALVAFANAYRHYAFQHPGRFAAARLPTRRGRGGSERGRAPLPDDTGDPARLRPDRTAGDTRGTSAGQRLPTAFGGASSGELDGCRAATRQRRAPPWPRPRPG